MNCFYTVTDVKGEKMHLHLCETHPVYEGHFPDQPVVPGVMTMGMVRECTSRLMGKRLAWKELKSCRFTGMLYPGDDVTLVLKVSSVKCQVSDDGDAVAIDAEISKISAAGESSIMLTLKGTLI